MKYTLLILLIATLFFSCNKEYENHCFEKKGEIAIEIRPLESFNRIVSWGVFKIFLKQDTAEFIEIECGKNLFPYIEANVENGALNIYDHVNCEWSRKYFMPRLTIHFKDLVFLKNQESVLFQSLDTLYLDNIWIYARSELAEINLTIVANQIRFMGSETTLGNYYLQGKTTFLDVEAHSAMVLDASGCISDSAYVNHRSIGDVKLNVKEKLRCSIKNRGNVVLLNEPSIVDIIENTGDGKVIFAE